MKKPIIGQEAICPDGLGRVIDFDKPNKNIRVQTYIKDRSCYWSADNVTLVKLNIQDDGPIIQPRKSRAEFEAENQSAWNRGDMGG
jgi:hypothetical protein